MLEDDRDVLATGCGQVPPQIGDQLAEAGVRAFRVGEPEGVVQPDAVEAIAVQPEVHASVMYCCMHRLW